MVGFLDKKKTTKEKRKKKQDGERGQGGKIKKKKKKKGNGQKKKRISWGVGTAGVIGGASREKKKLRDRNRYVRWDGRNTTYF